MISIAINQPYFFPYLGYYQLVESSDLFVFYDDVAYINKGWINRNKILINGKDQFITLSLQGASQHRVIQCIEILDNRPKLLRTIEMAYHRAPYYAEAIVPITKVLQMESRSIGAIAAASIQVVFEYLGMEKTFMTSSVAFPHTLGMEKMERLVAISKACNASRYVNLIGGQGMYDKAAFQQQGVELFFLQAHLPSYTQFKNQPITGLSMIDVMMFNSKETIRAWLKEFQLV
jgi:hypothetical protein